MIAGREAAAAPTDDGGAILVLIDDGIGADVLRQKEGWLQYLLIMEAGV